MGTILNFVENIVVIYYRKCLFITTKDTENLLLDQNLSNKFHMEVDEYGFKENQS